MDNKNQTYEEIDCIVKIEEMEPEQDFSSENQDANFEEVSMEKQHVITTRRRRGRPKKVQSTQYVPKKYVYSPEISLKNRFRPIRPKPLQPTSILRHKFISSMSSTPEPPNRIIVSGIDRNVDIVNSNINSGSKKSINNSNTENLPVTKKKRSSNCMNSSIDSNKSSNNSSDLHTKPISKSHKSSIELFFASMAQTVLNLPNEVQADIKMQICQIVTKAEIQHCESQTKSKTEN